MDSKAIRVMNDRGYQMKKTVMILWVSVFILTVDFSDGAILSGIRPESCTVFTACVGDTVLFGNNEDVGDKNASVWFVPATEKTYGLVYFGFQNYPIPNGYFPMGGMNDRGLCFDITSIPESVMNPHKKRLYTSNPGVFDERILRNCRSVEESIQFIEQYDLSSLDSYQFLFADRMGASIVLCPGSDGEMKVLPKEGVYQVITNFNLLRKELGEYPCWRYINASEMLAQIESENDLTVEYFAKILKTTSSEYTTYSTIYDPLQGVIYFFNKHNFDEVVVFNLKDQLEKGYHTDHALLLFPEKGELFKELEFGTLEEMKESEEITPESFISILFEPLSIFICMISTAVLVILIALVHRKTKEV
jgi:hypothetical protein